MINSFSIRRVSSGSALTFLCFSSSATAGRVFDLTAGNALGIMPRVTSVNGDLLLLHKGLGVRRPNLYKVIGPRLLGLWGVKELELRKIKIFTICHLETIVAEFSNEKSILTAKYAYNTTLGLADTLDGRLQQLFKLKGKGYSPPTTAKLLTGEITEFVAKMLGQTQAPPSEERFQLVLQRELGHAKDNPPYTLATPTTTELDDAMFDLTNPTAKAERAIDIFLRSKMYAPRPKDVGYVVRKTDREGYVMCVFNTPEALKVYQQANDPHWSGEYLALYGRDLVTQVFLRLPEGASIMVNPSAAGNSAAPGMSLPADLIRELHTGGSVTRPSEETSSTPDA